MYLLNKPAWLLGSGANVHNFLMDWYYRPDWMTVSSCSDAVFLFDIHSSEWSEYEVNIIHFIHCNSIATAVWAYFKAVWQIVAQSTL